MNNTEFSQIKVHLHLLVMVVILGAINYVTLKSTDLQLSMHVEGYQSQPSLLLPLLIFFPIGYFILYLGYKFGWRSMLPYHLSALAVFFPLVFVSSLSDLLRAMTPEMASFYSSEICLGVADIRDCGPALAHLTFCMTVRALPSMLVIPGTFYVLYKVDFLGMKALYEKD